MTSPAQPGTAELQDAPWSQRQSQSLGPSLPDLVSGGTHLQPHITTADPRPA